MEFLEKLKRLNKLEAKVEALDREVGEMGNMIAQLCRQHKGVHRYESREMRQYYDRRSELARGNP